MSGFTPVLRTPLPMPTRQIHGSGEFEAQSNIPGYLFMAFFFILVTAIAVYYLSRLSQEGVDTISAENVIGNPGQKNYAQ